MRVDDGGRGGREEVVISKDPPSDEHHGGAGPAERGEAAHALAESRAERDGFRARLAASLGGPEREVSEEEPELDRRQSWWRW